MKRRQQSQFGRRASREGGFTLVTAVFLITILMLLSAYMISFRVYQEAGTSLDTLGTRAYAAARSGAEWGAFNSLRNNACAASTPVTPANTLSGFTVTVTCLRNTFNEAGATVNMDTIVATACNNALCPPASPDANYVERQITILVSP
ncbi:MAG: agglutinin biosis protein MshP [Betaproteobacteria bacterium]|nr:agglutinin biosis protein MshP [Betaproteobacteria bacterium]